VGEGPRSGLTFPDIVSVARAYGIPSVRVENSRSTGILYDLLGAPGPALCEVMLDPGQEFEPRLTSRILADGRMASSALEDLYPFLDPAELRENMPAEMHETTMGD